MRASEAAHEEFCVRYVLWLLLLCPMAAAVTCPTNQQKDDNALIQIEQSWA